MRYLLFVPILFAGCSDPELPPPAVEVRVVERIVETQRPCPVTVPKRPAPLGELPSDAVALAAVLGKKLAEYSAPGAFADRALAALGTCTKD